MRSFLAGALALSLCSCTHSTYLTTGQIPVFVGAKAKHAKKRVAEGKNSFFFWGAVPKSHKVYIDKKLADKALVSAANVTLEEFQRFDDFLISCLSLGLFISKSYRITAYGMQAVQE